MQWGHPFVLTRPPCVRLKKRLRLVGCCVAPFFCRLCVQGISSAPIHVLHPCHHSCDDKADLLMAHCKEAQELAYVPQHRLNAISNCSCFRRRSFCSPLVECVSPLPACACNPVPSGSAKTSFASKPTTITLALLKRAPMLAQCALSAVW